MKVTLPSRKSKTSGLATVKFEGDCSPLLDSWDAMIDELEIEKQSLRSTKIGGNSKGRRTIGSFRRSSAKANDKGNSRSSRKSRRKSSLTPFAQTLLGNEA